MTDTILINIATGSLLPPLISILQQPRWAKWFRALATAAICIAVGYAEARAAGTVRNPTDAEDILRSVLIVFVAANATYKGFWKYTGTKQIENATALPDFGAMLENARLKAEENALIAEQEAVERAALLARARAGRVGKTITIEPPLTEQGEP